MLVTSRPRPRPRLRLRLLAGAVCLFPAVVGAQPSGPATPATTAPVVEERTLVQRRDEIAARVAVLRKRPEGDAPLDPQVAAIRDQLLVVLDRERLVLGSCLSLLQQIGEIEGEMARVRRDGTALAQGGPPDGPPWPLTRLDAALDMQEAERARLPALEASLAGARSSAGVERPRLAERLSAVESASRALELAEPGDRARLDLALELARAELAELRARDWLRSIELRVEETRTAHHRARLAYLGQLVARLRSSVDFPAESFDRLMVDLDKAAFALGREREAARLELGASEHRWSQSRHRLDAMSEPDEATSEEVRARQQDVQMRQREVAVLDLRISRLETARETWARRRSLLLDEVDAETARTWRIANQARLDSLEREAAVQEARLAEFAVEAGRFRTAADAAFGRDLRVERWIRERLRALEKHIKVAESNLASLAELRRLLGRLETELADRLRPVGLAGGLRALWEALGAYWDDHLAGVVRPVARIFLILLLGLPLNWFVSRRVSQAMGALYGPQSAMVGGKVVYYGGFTLLVIATLNETGVGVAPLLGAAGVTGVALGFASQTSVSNMISGLFLIAEQPFEVDHMVSIGDQSGEVLSIDLLSVKIRTFDNKFVRIPNETIIKANVVNFSKHPIRRVDIPLTVSYREDLVRVRDLLLDIAFLEPKVLQNPEPGFRVNGFGQHGAEVQLNVWVGKLNFLQVKTGILMEIKRRFDLEGIRIAFPHVSLHAGLGSSPFEVRVVGTPGAGAGKTEGPGAPGVDPGIGPGAGAGAPDAGPGTDPGPTPPPGLNRRT